MRACPRFSRLPSSPKSWAMALVTSTAWSRSTKTSMSEARRSPSDSPPPTNRLKPSVPSAARAGHRPMSLISAMAQSSTHPLTDILNLRGRLAYSRLPVKKSETARAADGTLGFNLLVGGGLSDGERLASDIDVFVDRDQAVEVTRAIAQLFGELGNRENRGQARMRYLVQELGPEGFREELAARARFDLVAAGEELTHRYRGDHVGVHPQKEDGLFYVGCSVPVGRMNGLELVEAARLAETYGDGSVRIGTDQNITFTGVPGDRVSALVSEDLLEKYSPTPGPFTRGVVACTGSEFCRYAIVETKERAVKWARFLDEQLAGEPVGARPPPGAHSLSLIHI